MKTLQPKKIGMEIPYIWTMYEYIPKFSMVARTIAVDGI
jgi:hypothetical protein